jgi:hypothetical protein
MNWTAEDLVASARREWDHWGRSTARVSNGVPVLKIGHTDDEKAFARYVIEKYCSTVGDSPTVAEIADDDYAWSAVGISTFLRNASVTKAEFPFSASHSKYIRHFIRARQENNNAARYWGYRIGESAGKPNKGDLVAYARGGGMTFAKAQKRYDSKGSYLSHTDLVVERRSNEIDVIGANVFDSVTLKTLPLGVDGHIADRNFHWFAVLKLRG